MNAFLFFLWTQDDLAGSTTIIVYACMRILKSQWLYTVMKINQKLRKQQNGEQNIEVVYTLCCSKEVRASS